MQVLPLIPSEPFYDFSTVIAGFAVVVNVRWNHRDGAWYFDLVDENERPIAHGLKIVLGAFIGRQHTHPLFARGVFVANAASNKTVDAGFDDIGEQSDGARVELRYYTETELAATINAGLVP